VNLEVFGKKRGMTTVEWRGLRKITEILGQDSQSVRQDIQ
jgi:hypothetical protein